MVEEDFSLIREYSDLGCFQRQHRIRYGITQTDGQMALTLEKTQDDKKETDWLLLPGMMPEIARQLVHFLYENAVPMENWKDVLEELMGMCKNDGK